MAFATVTSSSSDPLVLGGLLLIIVFIMCLRPVSRRHAGSRLVVLLLAFVAQLPTALAYRGPSKQPRSRSMMSDRVPRGSLTPPNKSVVKVLLMLWAFVIINLALWGLEVFVALLVPFLPVLLAVKCFASNLANHGDSSNHSPGIPTMSTWNFTLPLIAFIYATNRKPSKTKLYFLACLATISLGVAQNMFASYLSLQPLWLFRTINVVILAGHLGVWYLHLINTIDNPIGRLRTALNLVYVQLGRGSKTKPGDGRE